MCVNPLLILSLCFVATIGSPLCQMTDELPESRCCGKTAGSAGPKDIFRVIGGNKTDLYAYPWLVLLEYKINPITRKTTMCGGSLITGRLVLTAAHCITPDPPISVRLGEYNRSSSGEDCISTDDGIKCTNGYERIPISRIYVHKNYTEFFNEKEVHYNDIALLRLTKLAPYTDFIRPVCLPSFDVTSDPPSNLKLYAVGWGIMEQTRDEVTGKIIKNKFSTVKQHVALPYVTLKDCNTRWPNVGDTQMCAGGDEGKATCMGDSGGPIMYFKNVYELVGITSYGYELCGTETVPGVYTNVFNFRNMIDTVLTKEKDGDYDVTTLIYYV